MQKNIDEKEWIEDEEEADDKETIKLEIGESVKGILMDKFEFEDNFGKKNWGYVFKTADKDHNVLLFGTPILNRLMLTKAVNDEVCIERIEDKKSKAGRMCHNFKTYHKKV